MSWIKKNQSSTSFTLPIASGNALGGVKIGSGLSVGTDGTLSAPATPTPLANQITEIELIPSQLIFNVDSSNTINITPLAGQTLNVQYLNNIVSYSMPAISVTTNKSLFFNPSTGVFSTGFGNPSNQIILLTNNIYVNGVANFDNIRQGALIKYIENQRLKDYKVINPKSYQAITADTNAVQSMMFVGTELWVFDKDINTSSMYRRNPADFSLIASIPHSLGYWNSGDYNSEIDAIVNGNGTGAEDYTNIKASVYYNASNWKNLLTLSTATVQSIDIVFNEWNATGNNDMKVQATWGDRNFGRNDIIYVTTNEGRTHRKIMLGKGTNNLGHGNFTSGIADNMFNGTFTVLNTWTQVDGGGHVQDTFYLDGAIYNNSKLSIDVSGTVVWKHNLLANGAIRKEEIFIPVYDNLGNLAPQGSGEGITLNNGKIYCTNGYYFIIDNPF